jgi:cell division protease FtsH
MTNGREYSDETAKLVDGEIARILRAQETRAREVLTKHRRGLDLVAQRLLEEETIDGPAVLRLVQQGLSESASPSSSPAVEVAQSEIARDPG